MVNTSLKKFYDGENIFEEVFDDDEIKERSYLVIQAKEVMACDVSPVAMFEKRIVQRYQK